MSENRNFTTIIEKAAVEVLSGFLPEGETVEDYTVKVQLLKRITPEKAFEKGYIDADGEIIDK